MRILTTIKLSPHKYKTPEGYLVCQDAILARTGMQDYYKSEIYEDFDGEDGVVSVDRKPEQVFSAEAMASFENKPITVEHPDESVGPDNWDRLAVGNVRNVRKGTYNGQEVMIADLIINRADAIEDIESGARTELSCGYDCDITEGPNPQQINIRGNHIALCEAGRAGIAKIVDSKPAMKDKLKFNEWALKFKKLDAVALSELPEKRLDNLHREYLHYLEPAEEVKLEDKLEDKLYIIVNKRNQYYTGNKDGLPVLSVEKAKAKHMSKEEAEKIVNALGSSYKVKEIYNPMIDSVLPNYISKDQVDYNNYVIGSHGEMWARPAGQKEMFDFACVSYDGGNTWIRQQGYPKVFKAGNIRFRFKNQKNGIDYEIMRSLLTYLAETYPGISTKEFAAKGLQVDHKTEGNALDDRLENLQELPPYENKSKFIKYRNSLKKDVQPRKNESKDDFISRFMEETEKEYPDEKQRVAVAYSYWNRAKGINDMALPEKDKDQLKKYLAAVSKHLSNDIKIEDIINPIKEMGFNPIRQKIEGWYPIADGIHRKDYYFTVDNYDDLIMISLYANDRNDWKVDEVNCYFVGKKEDLHDALPEIKVSTQMRKWLLDLINNADNKSQTVIEFFDMQDWPDEMMTRFAKNNELLIAKWNVARSEADILDRIIIDPTTELGDFEVALKQSTLIKDSILQEYQSIRESMINRYGEDIYEYINEYLTNHEDLYLSDLYYNKDEWDKFYSWYKSEKINKLDKDSKKDSENKYVIYTENGKLKGTAYDNYTADIINANRVQSYDDFETTEQLIEYLLDNTNVKRENIINITDSIDLKKSFAKKKLKSLEKQLKTIEKEDEQLKDENRELFVKQKGKLKKELVNQIKKANKILEDSDSFMEEEIKTWYMKNFPEDDLGSEINSNVTFNDLFDTLDARQSVYKLLGNSIDSVIRERCFEKLATLIDSSYDYVYEQWLLCDEE